MPAIVPKPYKQVMQEYYALLGSLAKSADELYRENISRRLYLLGTKAEGLDTLNPKREIWQSIFVGEGESDWHVSPEPLPRNLTVNQLAEWIRERLKSEPLYIFAD